MKRILVLIAIILPLSAGASGDRNHHDEPDTLIINRNTVDRSVNQEQNQTVDQNQTQSIGDVTSTVSFDNDTAATVGRGSLFPTSICMGVVDAGFAVPAVGLSGGKTYVDEVCMQLEWIKAGFGMGMRDAAVWSWCNMSQAAENPYCHRDEYQDYKKEVLELRGKQELMLQDLDLMSKSKEALEKRATEAEEAAKKFAAERDEAIFRAGMQKGN